MTDLSPRYVDVAAYWEKRYQQGGSSGAGSVGRLASFKTQFLNDFIANNKIIDMIDHGCGDGMQQAHLDVNLYTGYDISITAVNRCIDLYGNLLGRSFLPYSRRFGLYADLAVSLDVIYHLVDDKIYYSYLEDLFASGRRFVIIYSTDYDKSDECPPHMRHRDFKSWVKEKSSFRLVRKVLNPYNSCDSCDEDNASPCSFFVFERMARINSVNSDKNVRALSQEINDLLAAGAGCRAIDDAHY